MTSLLNTWRNKTPEDFMANDCKLLIRLLNELAIIIIAQHLSELIYVKTDKRDESSPFEGLEIASFEKRVQITFLVHTHGVHKIIIYPTMTTSIHNWESGLIHDVIIPDNAYHNYHNLEYYIREVGLGKIVIDLLALDDYRLDTVRAYAVSQHNWTVASIGDLLISSHNYDTERRHFNYNQEGVHTKYEERLIQMIVTSLLYGCRHNEEDKNMRIVERIVDDRHSNTDGLIQLIESVVGTSGMILAGPIFDKEIVDFSLSRETSNGMTRIYDFLCLSEWIP